MQSFMGMDLPIINGQRAKVIDSLSLRLIEDVYKKRISPHKGWSCAGRVLGEINGDPKAISCSTHAVQLIRDMGVIKMRRLQAMQPRFDACHNAALELRRMITEDPDSFHRALKAIGLSGDGGVDATLCLQGLENTAGTHHAACISFVLGALLVGFGCHSLKHCSSTPS